GSIPTARRRGDRIAFDPRLLRVIHVIPATPSCLVRSKSEPARAMPLVRYSRPLRVPGRGDGCGVYSSYPGNAHEMLGRLGHFLHEQGNAVRALDDVLPDVLRDELVANDPVDHGIDFALRQPIDC